MIKGQRFRTIFFAIVIGVALTIIFLQNRTVTKKLAQCSVYTVAYINRVYRSRGMAHIEYTYKIDNQTIQADQSVNNRDTNDDWLVDMKKLSNRRLLVQVFCIDKAVHRINWNTLVPDTLQHIPTEGWKVIPF